MNPNMNLGCLFGGRIQQLPDGSFGMIGSPGGGGNLGDDNAVMMIDGLRGGVGDGQRASSTSVSVATFNLSGFLQTKVRIAGIDVPVWVALLVAAGVLGVAGWYFFVKRK